MESVYRLLDKASRMHHADWSVNAEPKSIATLLEQSNNMRALARYLSGKAGWEIRNGKYEDAVKTLRVGIAMGNHAAKANPASIFGMLVGIVLQGMMQDLIMTLESQPDAPNLYPALTQVTQPADSFQLALQGDLFFVFASKDGLQIFENIDKASPEQCRAKLENVVPLVFQLGANPWNSEPDKSRIAAAITATCTLCYPQARDCLLARGRTADEIEKLSVYQVVTPYLFEEIKAAYDRLLVTATFPVNSSHTAIASESQQPLKKIQSPVDTYVMLMMLPALNATRTACRRQHQTYELLKIIEAIRYYAAVHGGRLPGSLEAIKEIPVSTVDPMSGKPFGYKVEGHTAIIDYMHVDKCRLEITVEQRAAGLKTGK